MLILAETSIYKKRFCL